MLIDLHAHSSGISWCCQIPYQQVLEHARARGIDGIVLTNHYQKYYFAPGGELEFARRYVEEYEAAKQYSESTDCRVFFGAEVTMAQYADAHVLLYGIDPEFLLEYPTLCDFTMEQLYSLVKAHNGVVVQAHPFRGRDEILDPTYLDGIEINCHPKYGSAYADRILELAREHGLFVTCGGDYHADTYRPLSGMIIPDTVTDHHGIRDFLLRRCEKIIHMQEPDGAPAILHV